MSTNLKKETSTFFNWIQRGLSHFPGPRQWLNLPRVLNKKEKVLFVFFFLLSTASSLFLLRSLYLSRTEIVPAEGGTFREGVTTQPRFLNPVLASSETDQALTELLFAGLMEYNQKGEIEPELIQSLTAKSERGVYEVTLKDNLFWSDGERITAEDVVFTVNTIQDPAYKSPKRTNWVGVETKLLSERKVRFSLEKPYYPFRERLTLKPIPKHIFKEIPPEEFALSSFNLMKAVSSGPFKVEDMARTEEGSFRSLNLIRNRKSPAKDPYLKEFVFTFFPSEKKLQKGLEKGKVDGAVLSNPKQLKNKIRAHKTPSPRYFGLFFNPGKKEILDKKEVRKAVSLLLERGEIVREAVPSRGKEARSPILPALFGFEREREKKENDSSRLLKESGLSKKGGGWVEASEKKFSFQSRLEKGDESSEVKDLQKCLARFEDIYPEGKVTSYFGSKTEKAVIRFQEKYEEEILAPWNFEEGTGIVSKTTGKKLNEVCNRRKEEPVVGFRLTTVDQPFLLKAAREVERQLEEAGFEIEVEKQGFGELSREKIKKRDYEVLLFGEMLGLVPDPYPFWHSSQVQDPGLNLAFYESEEADKYLEKARSAKNRKDFRKNLLEFERQFFTDQPAVILFALETRYLTTSRLRGLDFEILADPARRFEEVEKWHLKTKRVLK